MLIGLISDTHIREARRELWPQVFDAFRGVDAILHAGTSTTWWSSTSCTTWHPPTSPAAMATTLRRTTDPAYDPRLREAWVLEFDGVRVGITHDVPIQRFRRT